MCECASESTLHVSARVRARERAGTGVGKHPEAGRSQRVEACGSRTRARGNQCAETDNERAEAGERELGGACTRISAFPLR